MTSTERFPWLDRYKNVPDAITPGAATALEMFTQTLERAPDAPLAHYFHQSISARQFDELSDAFACELKERGVEHGDRVAMYLQNIPQVFSVVLAAWKCGAVIVPCNPMLKERELVKILADSGSRVLVCQEDLYADVAQAAIPATAVEHVITTSPLEYLESEAELPGILANTARMPSANTDDLLELINARRGQKPEPIAITGDDVAFMVYTSGTTGQPKAAMNTHSNVVFATSVYQHWMSIDEQDTILGLAPLFHVTGLVGHVTLAMLTGAPLILFYRFDANEACKLTQLHKATFTVSAVTAFIALLESEGIGKYDMSSLQKIYTGGAPTPPRVLEDWHGRFGVRIHPMYGLTEATSPTHATPFGEIPPIDQFTGAMSVGVPVFNTVCRVMKDSGREAAPGEIGEFVISGPQIIPAYFQRPNETAKALSDGALRTGDVGFMDANGWFYLVDRSKDMIVASGFKVWPREVEEVLYQHPAVREAAVVGVPDEYRGETIKAVVSLKEGTAATEDEIKAFARDQLAAYKYPRVVEIMDDLPKTTSGKIMRRLLQPTREQVMQMETTAGDLVDDASYPKLRISLEARAVLQAGSVWLRLSRGSLPRETSKHLYELLRSMFSNLTEEGDFVKREAFFDANRAYHLAIVDLAENEHLSVGFDRLKLRRRLGAALKDQPSVADNSMYFHEFLTDSLAAGDRDGALKAILSWSKNSASVARRALGFDYDVRADQDLRAGTIVEDLSIAVAPDSEGLASDVDALIQALDARAAIEIGITQTLGPALSVEAGREALVARLRAFMPLVRGAGPAAVARYIRADDSFHRVFLSTLRNPVLFEIYNSMDLPELMRRIIEVAPPSIREVFDDHRQLTRSLQAGDANATCHAIADHTNRIREALAELLAAADEDAAPQAEIA
jgi:long-chain acyl-CoA synthetase